MPARPRTFRRIRDWRLGAGVIFALVCFLVPMTALAVASTGRPAGPAIPQKALDRILHGLSLRPKPPVPSRSHGSRFRAPLPAPSSPGC